MYEGAKLTNFYVAETEQENESEQQVNCSEYEVLILWQAAFIMYIMYRLLGQVLYSALFTLV